MLHRFDQLIYRSSLICSFAISSLCHAALLTPSVDAYVRGYESTTPVAISGTSGLLGAFANRSYQGETYLFDSLDSDNATISESTTLYSSDRSSGDYFGYSVSLSGQTGLVGSVWNNTNGNFRQGSAYLYSNINSSSSFTTETTQLIASDGVSYDSFGFSVSLSDNTALIGAIDDNSEKGSAYLFRNLDSASGTITESAKLIASDGMKYDWFGYSVSLSGNSGLIGTLTHDNGDNTSSVVAYLFRDLDTATGTVTESARLTTSDSSSSIFPSAVSLSGSTALIGAGLMENSLNASIGAAYLFRNVDTATGTITESAKLISSDPQARSFGASVALSQSTALIGAPNTKSEANSNRGAVYLFQNLDAHSVLITETLKITASSESAAYYFGCSLDIDGDLLIIGAKSSTDAQLTLAKAYTGSVSSLTTLNEGDASRVISGISFESRTNWIIGQTTDANQVTLSVGDTADVTSTGMAVYVGQQAGSDNNTLFINGNLIANTVYIGSTDGNFGNTLQFGSSSSCNVDFLRLSQGNSLTFAGDYADSGSFLSFLGNSTLQVWNALTAEWTTIDANNFNDWLAAQFTNGYTTFTPLTAAVPEPSTTAVFTGILGLGFVISKRRRRAS